MITTERLMHGGVMANYKCTAACRHCLYACSPDRTGGYISEDTGKQVAKLLRSAGCRSMHIGGGEPFMDFEGLVDLVRNLSDGGVNVEYIETNASWVTDEKQCELKLRELYKAGADTLCISLDPFHAEYVPIDRPLTLAKICRSIGFGYFLWQERFMPMMSRLDKSKKHSRAEMEELISPKYISETARSYGINYGGRAVNIEAEYVANKQVKDIIKTGSCRSLVSGGHFHVDMYGRYVPPGCTGIIIPLDEAINGIPDGKYPVFEALLSGGTEKLLEYAIANGFTENPDGYPSGCALCINIRHWLSINAPSPELDPEHYSEALKYY